MIGASTLPYNYNGYNATNNTAVLSEHSIGGITSKRSHKHLLDSDNRPIASKQETEDIEDLVDDEPADPMLEPPDNNDFSSRNRLKQTSPSPAKSYTVNEVIQNHAPSYELDLQDYGNHGNVPNAMIYGQPPVNQRIQ